LVTLFGIGQENAYRTLKDSVDKLWGRTVLLEGDWKDGKKIRWLSSQKYSEGKGQITINFGREMLKEISGMVDYFTSYKLLAVSGFKSIHSVRVYELCKQFIGTGFRIVTVADFRLYLGLENEHADWRNLKKWTLDRTLKEINSKSDLTVNYTLIKKGRNIHAIKFLIDKNDQYSLPL
jgi:plasmid replication initiation protein